MAEEKREMGEVVGFSPVALRAPSVKPTTGGQVGPLKPDERWSMRRKREVVLRLLRGELVQLLSRELGVEIYRLEQ